MKDKKIIYVVFKTHFDIGFTELAGEVIQRYGSKMLPDVVKTCEDTRDSSKKHKYVWTMPAWPLLQSLDPGNAEADVISRARALIRQEQIAWHVLPFTTHTEFCGLEEYIRGMYFSRQLSEEYGKWPVSAKMTDVPGHTWVLPSLLYKAGVRFLHLGCNSGCTPPDVPRLFFWEGPDGSRVLTFYSKGSYGSSLIPPEDWNFPVWLALLQTNDNVGPQGPEIVEQIIKTAASELPGAEVVVGTMDDFYRGLTQYPLDHVPVVRGDLADTWIHGIGTYPAEVGKIRALRPKLALAEKALSFGLSFGSISAEDGRKHKNSIDRAFEQALLFGEHTWGLDVKTTLGYDRQYGKEEFRASLTKPAYRRMEESWKEQRQREVIAGEAVGTVLPEVLEALAANVDADGARLAVFNGLGWKRNAWVDIDDYREVIGDRELLDMESGQIVRKTCINSRWMAYVEGLPALGYKALAVKEGKNDVLPENRLLCDAGTGILENKWFRLAVDRKTGGILSLKEKSDEKEWVDGAGGNSLGQYRYEIYGIEDITEFIRTYSYRFYDWLVNDLGRLAYPEIKHRSFLSSQYSVAENTGDGAASLILSAELKDESNTEYGNASRIELHITLYEDQPYIDMLFKLDGKEETPVIEAGHFIFPIRLANPEIRINKLGSVVNPETDIVRDANHALYCCENWVDISDGVRGMAIIPYDTPLFSLGDQMIYKYRKSYEKTEPTVFFNCFNNSWGTNFPQWIGGDLAFRYRLIPHSGNWMEGNIPRHALESIAQPLAGYAAQRRPGDTGGPVSVGLIEKLDGMEVLCFKPAEKGNGYILRVREMNGEQKEARLVFHGKIKTIGVCDLLENNCREIGRDTGKVVFSTKPFEIHTFLVCLS